MCDSSPMYFEKIAERHALRLRRRLQDLHVDWELGDTLEDIYNLACGVEYAKLNTDNFWKRCDAAVGGLGIALDELIDAFDHHYTERWANVVNLLLAARSRIHRSLRASLRLGNHQQALSPLAIPGILVQYRVDICRAAVAR